MKYFSISRSRLYTLVTKGNWSMSVMIARSSLCTTTPELLR